MDELRELTQLWQVGVAKREQAHDSGIYHWDDPGATPEALGVTGAKTGPTLKKILAVNTGTGKPVHPARIDKTKNEWYTAQGIEFYVDFEFCSDLNDDFSKLPEKGGQPLIFMIGCGHLENGSWRFKSFVTPDLSEAEEIRIINEWVEYMSNVRDGLEPHNDKPRVFHWSHAEVTQLENAYNSASVKSIMNVRNGQSQAGMGSSEALIRGRTHSGAKCPRIWLDNLRLTPRECIMDL